MFNRRHFPAVCTEGKAVDPTPMTCTDDKFTFFMFSLRNCKWVCDFRVFHNVPGKLMQIEDLKIQLKKNMSNSTAKTRIEGLIRWDGGDEIYFILITTLSGMLRRSCRLSPTRHNWGNLGHTLTPHPLQRG